MFSLFRLDTLISGSIKVYRHQVIIKLWRHGVFMNMFMMHWSISSGGCFDCVIKMQICLQIKAISQFITSTR